MLVSLSSLVYCNTPAYWAHSHVTKKMKHCEYVPTPSLFSSQLMNRPNKIEHLLLVNFSSLVYCNALAYKAHSQVTKKMKHREYILRPYLFPLQLMNRPNKIECLLMVSLSSLVYFNTPAFWAHSQETKKMKHCEYVPTTSLFS